MYSGTEGNGEAVSLRKSINEKKRIANRLLKGKKKYAQLVELKEQIVICEQLGKPLTESEIENLCCLNMIQMENRIRTHKFA